MLLTSGVDLIELERIERLLVRHDQRALQRIYTPAELAYCQRRVPELAARFAAKEAVSKALGVGLRMMSPTGIAWHDVETLPDERGRPLLKLYGRAEARAAELGLVTWSISFSHSRDYAIAFIVAIGKE